MRKILILTAILTLTACQSTGNRIENTPQNPSQEENNLTSSNMSASAHTLEEILQNENNQLNFPKDPQVNLQSLNTTLASYSLEELETYLTAPNRTLPEVSFALFYLSNQYFVAGDFSTGLELLETNAEIYKNPFAFTRLASFYFLDTAEIRNKFPDAPEIRDLKKSLEYINTAFELAKYIDRDYTQSYIRNIVIQQGLGTYDSFNLQTTKEEFNVDSAYAEIQPNIKAHVEKYIELYE